MLWSPTLVDAVDGSGNLQGLIGSRGTETTVGIDLAAERVVDAVGPLPRFLRSTTSTLADRPALVVFIAATILGLLASLALVARRRRADDVARLITVTLLLALGGLFVGARIPVDSIFRAELFGWVLPTGLLVWIGLATGLGSLIPADSRDRVRRGITAPLVVALLGLGTVIALVGGGRPASEWDGRDMPAHRRLLSEVDSALPEGTYRFRQADSKAWLTSGPALMNHLDGTGRTLLLDDRPVSRSIHPPTRIGATDTPIDGILTLRSRQGDGRDDPPEPDAPEIDELARVEADGHTLVVTLEPS